MSKRKCTPFCSQGDNHIEHHELLVALLNTDGYLSCVKQPNHKELSVLITKYVNEGWDKNSAIMDKNEEFRFPLIHWACVLGKPKTVKWLLENDFRPDVQSIGLQETALHRCLLTLPDLSIKQMGKYQLFMEMLKHFKNCLIIGDHRSDTPLHVAAKFMIRNRHFLFYESCLEAMIKVAHNMCEEERNVAINGLNITGDTVLHILAENNRSYFIIQMLLDSGADPLIANKLNCNALDTAIQKSAVRIVHLLKRSLLQKVWNNKPDVTTGMVMKSDSKKRRSERKHISSISYDLDCSPSSEQSCSPPQQDKFVPGQIIKSIDEEVTSSNPNLCNNMNIVVKQELFKDGICQCDDNDEHLSVTSSEEDNTTTTIEGLSHKGDLLGMFRQSGVSVNLEQLISDTRSEHVKQLEIVQESIKEADSDFEKSEKKEKDMQLEINRLHHKLAEMSSQLAMVKNTKEKASNKRKLMQDESENLRRKMLCCESLLESVTKN